MSFESLPWFIRWFRLQFSIKFTKCESHIWLVWWRVYPKDQHCWERLNLRDSLLIQQSGLLMSLKLVKFQKFLKPFNRFNVSSNVESIVLTALVAIQWIVFTWFDQVESARSKLMRSHLLNVNLAKQGAPNVPKVLVASGSSSALFN